MAAPERTAATRVIRDADGRWTQSMRAFGLQTKDELHSFCQPRVCVGSAGGNDLALTDDAVSRIHFEIRAEAEGFRLVDLESTNGTVVDGHRVRDIYLNAGSSILVGQTELRFQLLDEEVEIPMRASDRFGPLVGTSPAMRQLFSKLERIASTDFTVLIEGETGTGKELVAEAIHAASTRSGGPFMVFDSGAVPPSLIESELFGHEKGAFTGADTARTGCIEAADGGTLLLDEIGELPLSLQPKLLRVLEKRALRRLGSNEVRRVDVRFLAATNRDLAREVNAGGFREDLYYRLAVAHVIVPPLRERPEDVRTLVTRLVRRALADPPRARDLVASISDDNWQALERHPWRGNVRELRNVVETALAFSSADEPLRIEPGAVRAAVNAEQPLDLRRPFIELKRDVIAAFEKDYLTRMLEQHGGKIARAAEAAGIDRTYFARMLRRYQG